MARPSHDAEHAPWLRAITILYLCWSLIPLVIAIVFSFNAAPSVSRWEGFSLYWWVGRPRDQLSLVYDPQIRRALLHSLTLAFWTTVVAVPMGTAFALGARGWPSRAARAGLAAMILVLVVPRIAVADEMYIVLLLPLRRVPFG